MRARANEIIVSLMQSDEFANCMKKVKPELKQDLAGELALILLETNPEKIIQLHDKRQLTFYTVRIILTLAFSKTSPFYKKYRVIHEEFIDMDMPDDCSANMSRVQAEDRVLMEIERLLAIPDNSDNQEYYYRGMLRLYLEEGTYRNMNKKTRIPVMTCFEAVKTITQKIQKVI